MLSQILVLFAIVFDLISFQFKSQRKIVCCLFFAAGFNSLHFFLLEQWTAAGLMALGSLRYFTSIFTISKIMLIVFSIASIMVASVTYMGLISILACCGSLIKTAAAFCKSDQVLRQLMILGTACWIVHNYIVGSPTAVILEWLFLLSNFVGYYRYYIMPLRNKVEM
ncbi:MAG: hypothetical protein ACI9UT_001190 [Flavobacteriales bacterium]|jgi:hypothetical protein